MEGTHFIGLERSDNCMENTAVVEDDQIIFMPFWKEYEEYWMDDEEGKTYQL